MSEPSFNCRLESVDIKYQAFDRDGAPLHAVLAATFVEQLDPAKRAAADNLSSPDLTHRRVVAEGDTLPLLFRAIYGSPSHYLRVAQVNGLDDFRSLTAGQELIFPPFERAPGG
jgi:nucleoid-associated protein YgaU